MKDNVYSNGLTQGYAMGYKDAMKLVIPKLSRRRKLVIKLEHTFLYQPFCKHLGRENDKPYPTVKQLREGFIPKQTCCKCGKHL